MAGTWLLPLFLVTALTGLFWASDAYRNLLLKLAGATAAPAASGRDGAARATAACTRARAHHLSYKRTQ